MSERLLFELVVPCFNEASSIPNLIQEFQRAGKAHGFNSSECKLLLVNNGSTDETTEVLEREKDKSTADWFQTIHLEPNQGYGGGILKGLESTQASWVGYSHADLQCPLDDAFKAFEKCRKIKKNSLVRGKRQKRKVGDWIISRFYDLVVGLTWGFWSYDLNAQPKVFNRELIDHLKGAPRGISFDAFVLRSAQHKGFQTETIPVFLLERQHGISHWAQNPIKRIRTFLAVFKELRRSSLTS